MLVIARRLSRRPQHCWATSGGDGSSVAAAQVAQKQLQTLELRALFSSKRRPRYGDEEQESKGRRGKKLLSIARAKQQKQLNKLKEVLAKEDLVSLPVPLYPAMAPTGQKSRTKAAESSSWHDQKEFSRMLNRKKARSDRVKHLPLFRSDSALMRHFGERTLGDYEALPCTFFAGDITVLHSAEEEAAHLEYLRAQKVIGVDTEAKPDFRPRKQQKSNPVCLIQVSTLERAFLYRLKRGELLPPVLQELFADPTVLKVGHSLNDDFRQLKQSQLVQAVNSTMDTLPIASKLGCLRPGLKTLCQLFLGGSISKEMQVSNWEAHELSAAQISYAATDAWAPLRVLLAMIQLEDAKVLLRTKSFDASARAVMDDDHDKILGLLHAFALRHHVPTQVQADAEQV